MEITETTIIDAPIERVWALTVDLEQLPSITPTITRVERLDDGAVQVGSRARVSQPGMPGRVWTVNAVEAPHSFSWFTRLMGVRMMGVHDLEGVGDDKTRLTLRVVFEGRGAGLLGRLARPAISKALAAEAAGCGVAAGCARTQGIRGPCPCASR